MTTFWAVIVVDTVDQDGNTIIDLQDATTTVTSTVSCGSSIPPNIAATLSDPYGLLATTASCRHHHATSSASPTPTPTPTTVATVTGTHKSSAVPIAVGVTIPVIAILALLAAWFWFRRRTRAKVSPADDTEYEEEVKPARTFSDAGYRTSEGLQALSAFPDTSDRLSEGAMAKGRFTALPLPSMDPPEKLAGFPTMVHQSADLPEVLHELDGQRSLAQDRQPSDLPEVVGIEDEEIRRLEDEKARLRDRRSRLEELERLQSEEDRVLQQLEERRELLRTR